MKTYIKNFNGFINESVESEARQIELRTQLQEVLDKLADTELNDAEKNNTKLLKDKIELELEKEEAKAKAEATNA